MPLGTLPRPRILGSANILNTTVAIGFGLFSIPMMKLNCGALPSLRAKNAL